MTIHISLLSLVEDERLGMDTAAATTDPRDYPEDAPLCACGNPLCMPGSTVGHPHEYEPHPDSPATFHEHAEALLEAIRTRIATLKRWPRALVLLRKVEAAIGRRFDDQVYAQARRALRLTEGQWLLLVHLAHHQDKEVAGRFEREAAEELVEKGYAAFDGKSRAKITQPGRARHALGKGPR